MSRICLCVMAKDEEETILRTLESAKTLISFVALLLDERTTDKTFSIVENFCTENKIGFRFQSSPWKNFGENRNECLKLGRETGCEWLLILDADDYLIVEKNFIFELLEDAYQIKVIHGNLSYFKTQIIRASLPFYFDMPTHEALYCSKTFSCKQLSGIEMKIGSGDARKNATQLFLNDIKLLEIYLQQFPNHLRALFYLAQSYRDYGDLHKASDTYQKRARLGGWLEEVYVSLLEHAKCQERLNASASTVAAAYFGAYTYRPSRGEAQWHLVRYLKSQAFPISDLANLLRKSPPPEDILFIEPGAYGDYDTLFPET